jgi:tRNA nucleotidyltransferase (CCA-adding enzyme)
MNLDLWQFFDPERSHILNTALKITQDRGWKIYAVGGLVRDGLMSVINGSEFSPLDVDLVVDGGKKSGIEVAIAFNSMLKLCISSSLVVTSCSFNLQKSSKRFQRVT